MDILCHGAAGLVLTAMALWWLGYEGEREFEWTVAIATGMLLVGIVVGSL